MLSLFGLKYGVSHDISIIPKKSDDIIIYTQEIIVLSTRQPFYTQPLLESEFDPKVVVSTKDAESESRRSVRFYFLRDI